MNASICISAFVINPRRHFHIQRRPVVVSRLERIKLQVNLNFMSLCSSQIHCITRIRTGLQALRDCSRVFLAGCVFKSCGYDSGCGLQFGLSSSSSGGDDSAALKSFGTLLNHCIISDCGEDVCNQERGQRGGMCIRIVSGSSAELRRCNIVQSVSDSIHVLRGSTLLMKMCCVYASVAGGVVFGDKSSGQLLNCRILETSGNSVELSGKAFHWCEVKHRHIVLQVLQVCSSPEDA